MSLTPTACNQLLSMQCAPSVRAYGCTLSCAKHFLKFCPGGMQVTSVVCRFSKQVHERGQGKVAPTIPSDEARKSDKSGEGRCSVSKLQVMCSLMASWHAPGGKGERILKQPSGLYESKLMHTALEGHVGDVVTLTGMFR